MPTSARPRSAHDAIRLPFVLLAGGLGRRFGGAKQVEPVGPAGEPLGAYTAFDALAAGFTDLVLITRPGEEEGVGAAFRDALGAAAPIRTLAQRLAPSREARGPAGRTRPWGTGHAVLAAAEGVEGAFAVANADDAYGSAAIRTLRAALSRADDNEVVLVTYPLRAVLSAHGGVSRGWVREGSRGAEVIEVHDLRATGPDTPIVGRVEGGGTVALGPETPVSMNLWGLTPAAIAALRDAWSDFVEAVSDHPAGPLEAEFQLSTALSALATEGRVRITPHGGGTAWFGITWPEDLAAVRRAVEAIHRSGAYPVPLAGPLR